MDLADGLEMGSPYLHLYSPDLALSRGGGLHCSPSPLSESVLICNIFTPRRFILFYIQVARVLPRQRVHYGRYIEKERYTIIYGIQEDLGIFS